MYSISSKSYRTQTIFFSMLIFLLNIFLIPAPVKASSVDTLNNGLVGYWKMDEKSWNGTAGEVKDSSGNGNDGVAMNKPLLGNGNFGNAGKFGNSWLEFKDNDSLDVEGKNQISVSVWLRVEPSSNYRAIVSKGYAAENGGYALRITRDTEPIKAFFQVSNTAGATASAGNYNNIANNTWTHIVGTYNGAEICLYVNGELDGRCVPFSGNIKKNDLPLQIARSTEATSPEYFPGYIDEVRLYKRVLSTEEIVGLHENRIDTLSINLPPTSTTTLTNYIPIEFTAKLSLPKKSEGASFDNQVNIKFADGHLIPFVYEKQDEQDGLFLWKGSYRKTNALSNKNFDFQGTLEFADCSKIEGSSIEFEIADNTPGTYTFRNDQKDKKEITQRDFLPNLSSTSNTTQNQNWFAWLGTWLNHFFTQQKNLPTQESKTDFLERKQATTSLASIEARKMCGASGGSLKPFGSACALATECSDGIGVGPGWCKNGVCTDPWIAGTCSSIRVYRTDSGYFVWRTTNKKAYPPQVVNGNLAYDNSVDFAGLTSDIEGNANAYPARQACKEIGGRLPTSEESQCLFVNRAEYVFPGDCYWTLAETGSTSALWNCMGGSGRMYGGDPKTQVMKVRCVR